MTRDIATQEIASGVIMRREAVSARRRVGYYPIGWYRPHFLVEQQVATLFRLVEALL